MGIKIDNKDLLERLLKGIHSDEVKQVVSRQMHKEMLLENKIHFGDWDNLTLSPKANDAGAIKRFAQATFSELQAIRQSREKKTKIVFRLSFLTIGTALALVFVGLVLVFWQQQDKQLTIITLSSSLILFFFGILLFKLYERENKDLKGIEMELAKIEKLESFFELVSRIESSSMLDEAYRKLIAQMEV